MEKPEKEQTDNLEEQDAPMILEDPELTELALHLRQTQHPIVDPAYRETLQSKLLKIVRAQRQKKGHDEMGSVETKPEIHSRQNTPGADAEQQESTLPNEPDAADLEDDAELAALARHLQQTVPAVDIDPRFQEALQEKLLDVVRRPSGTASKKRSRRVLALKLGCPI